jgi:predicted RecB family endonuclease
MAVTRPTLPDLKSLDADALRALILGQQEALASRDTEIENLKLLVLKLKRLQFGRKSEKLDNQIEQLELRLEDLEASQTARPLSTFTTPPSVLSLMFVYNIWPRRREYRQRFWSRQTAWVLRSRFANRT